jgi:AT hook motif
MSIARNLKTCAAVFEELVSSSPVATHPQSGFEPAPKPTLKRRLSDTEPTPGVTRTLHPKPAANGAQFAPLQSPADSSSKKRGRPTKEVLDARRAEAAARGTMYPPLKAAGRKSMGETSMSQLSFGSQGPASEPGLKTGGSSDNPSSKKRRGRPPKDVAERKQVRYFFIRSHINSAWILTRTREWKRHLNQ